MNLGKHLEDLDISWDIRNISKFLDIGETVYMSFGPLGKNGIGVYEDRVSDFSLILQLPEHIAKQKNLGNRTCWYHSHTGNFCAQSKEISDDGWPKSVRLSKQELQGSVVVNQLLDVEEHNPGHSMMIGDDVFVTREDALNNLIARSEENLNAILEDPEYFNQECDKKAMKAYQDFLTKHKGE